MYFANVLKAWPSKLIILTKLFIVSCKLLYLFLGAILKILSSWRDFKMQQDLLKPNDSVIDYTWQISSCSRTKPRTIWLGSKLPTTQPSLCLYVLTLFICIGIREYVYVHIQHKCVIVCIYTCIYTHTYHINTHKYNMFMHSHKYVLSMYINSKYA